MVIFSRSILLILLSLSQLVTAPVRAEQTEFDYDIFSINDTLAIWVDVTPMLTQSRLEDLLSGLDIYVKVEIKIQVHKVLFISKTLKKTGAAFLISHPLTEDIYRLKISNFVVSKHEFDSQLSLSDFLADSMVFKIAPVEDIEQRTNLRIKMGISCKSLSSIVIPDKYYGQKDGLLPADTSETEILLDIFSLFIDLIGYGEDKCNISTAIFDLEDLPDYKP
jgi:hypothetical protein